MGRKFTAEEAPPYYPPRARWFSALIYFARYLRQRLKLARFRGFRLPTGMRVSELVASFLVPGLAVYLRAPPPWKRAALPACAALLLVYIVWPGHPVANLAFGLLLSVHCTGFVYYCNPLMAQERFRTRLSFTLLVLLAMMMLLYRPAHDQIQQHLFTPLEINGHVIVVHRTVPAQAIRRGDYVWYALGEASAREAHDGGAVQFGGGAGMGTVLAMGGDDVIFSPDGFYVNGILHTKLPHMPAAGEWVVPEKHWFIWPNLAISRHGNVSEHSISDIVLRLADVAPGQYLGQPFHHWLWRKQILP